MTRAKARTDMMYTLETLQEDLRRNWIDSALPDDWNGLETWEPVARPKIRVTLRLDADMVAWFRKMGPGHGARINRVLRVYWTALMAGHVKGHFDDDVTPRLRAMARRMEEEWDR